VATSAVGKRRVSDHSILAAYPAEAFVNAVVP